MSLVISSDDCKYAWLKSITVIWNSFAAGNKIMNLTDVCLNDWMLSTIISFIESLTPLAYEYCCRKWILRITIFDFTKEPAPDDFGTVWTIRRLNDSPGVCFFSTITSDRFSWINSFVWIPELLYSSFSGRNTAPHSSFSEPGPSADTRAGVDYPAM